MWLPIATLFFLKPGQVTDFSWALLNFLFKGNFCPIPNFPPFLVSSKEKLGKYVAGDEATETCVRPNEIMVEKALWNSEETNPTYRIHFTETTAC